MITNAIRASVLLLFPSRQQVNMINISTFIFIHVPANVLFYRHNISDSLLCDQRMVYVLGECLDILYDTMRIS